MRLGLDALRGSCRAAGAAAPRAGCPGRFRTWSGSGDEPARLERRLEPGEVPAGVARALGRHRELVVGVRDRSRQSRAPAVRSRGRPRRGAERNRRAPGGTRCRSGGGARDRHRPATRRAGPPGPGPCRPPCWPAGPARSRRGARRPRSSRRPCGGPRSRPSGPGRPAGHRVPDAVADPIRHLHRLPGAGVRQQHANSSPPTRATVSPVRTESRSAPRPAGARRRRRPRPNSSLTRLKSSQSTSSAESGPCPRSRPLVSRTSARSSPRRFSTSVSGSWSARRASRSWAARPRGAADHPREERGLRSSGPRRRRSPESVAARRTRRARPAARTAELLGRAVPAASVAARRRPPPRSGPPAGAASSLASARACGRERARRRAGAREPLADGLGLRRVEADEQASVTRRRLPRQGDAPTTTP